ncbi:MAG: hypothetical protein QGH42_00200 [Kiritimatiellia bacterium]|jgi:hypothetical protein|nr:hypothetical protein [Pseudomonadales bacterium]MDP7022656.1 hypothetical protein [Kiritimatiellia bacterium]
MGTISRCLFIGGSCLLLLAVEAGAEVVGLSPHSVSVGRAIRVTTTAPLRDLLSPPRVTADADREGHPASTYPIPRAQQQSSPATRVADPVVQSGAPEVASMPGPLATFEGLDNISGYAPPDVNGDVGPNHYVQMMNVHFCI